MKRSHVEKGALDQRRKEGIKIERDFERKLPPIPVVIETAATAEGTQDSIEIID